MATETLTLYRNTSAPATRIKFTDRDFTGETIEFVITPAAKASTTFSSVDGGLTIESAADGDVVVWDHSQAFVNTLDIGESAALDVFQVNGGSREKLAAFRFRVGGVGDYFEPSETVVQVSPPGITVYLVEYADWPPPADDNPLHIYMRVADAG